MTDARKCYTVNDISKKTGMPPKLIQELTKKRILKFTKKECDKKEGKIIIYNDTALKKFLKYSKENYVGKK